jgi:periplasmic protein TonB
MKRYWLLVLALASVFLPPMMLCQDDSAKAAPETVYRMGGVVKAPRPIYAPDPEYPEKARKEHLRGVIVLQFVIGADGLPRSIKVKRPLSPELDEAATDALKKWKFAPATKDDQPVAVMINVEMTVGP